MPSLSVSVLVFLSLISALTHYQIENREITLLSGDVMITATVTEESPGELYGAEISVRHDPDSFAYSSMIDIHGDRQKAIDVLKQGIGWKEGFLFVRLECGGGNAWRCSREQVFALRQGRLIHFGEILGGEREEKPGRHYQDGWFSDIYDKFELNTLVGHAFAPGIRLFERVVSDHLEVDLERTWLENQKDFDLTLPEIEPRNEQEEVEIIHPLLHNAVIAKYCRRDAELQAALELTHAHLDKDRLDRLMKILADVVPGDGPRQR